MRNVSYRTKLILKLSGVLLVPCLYFIVHLVSVSTRAKQLIIKFRMGLRALYPDR